MEQVAVRRLRPAAPTADNQDGSVPTNENDSSGSIGKQPAGRPARARATAQSNSLPDPAKTTAASAPKPQPRLPIDDLTREFMSRQLRLNQEMRAAGLKRQGRDKRPGADAGHGHHHDESHGQHDHSHADHDHSRQAPRSEDETSEDGLGGGTYQVPDTDGGNSDVPEVPAANSFDPSAPRSELQFDDLHPGIQRLALTGEEDPNGSDLTSYAAEAAANGETITSLRDEDFGGTENPDSSDEEADERLDAGQGTGGQKRKGYPAAKPSKGYPPAKPDKTHSAAEEVRSHT